MEEQMDLPFQPCVDKSCPWGCWRGKKRGCALDPSQYNMCLSGGNRHKKSAVVSKNPSTNARKEKELKTERFEMKMTKSEKDRLEKAANKDGRSSASLIRYLIKKYLDRK
jgi:hypothetical protein